MTAPTRRRLLGGIAAVATTAAAAAQSSAAEPTDSELVSACTEYLRVQRAFEAYCSAAPGDMQRDDPGFKLLDAAPDLAEKIVVLHATTAEGHLARLRCWALPYAPGARDCLDDPEAAREDRFLAAATRDLVSLERGTALPSMKTLEPVTERRPAANPDAELLDACAAFDPLERAYVAAIMAADGATGWERAMLEAEATRLSDEQEPLIARMCRLHAVTWAGMAARARSLAVWDAELLKVGTGDTGSRLTTAIVRDLLRWEE